MDWVTEKDGTIRILTFQSKVVLDKIKQDGVYYADDSKKRERRDYSLDKDQLGGHQPVWGFAIPSDFKARDIYRGSLFIHFKCEMSLSESILSDFVCLELFVPSELVKLGLSHNACYFAVVYPYIKKEYLHRVYNIEYVCAVNDSDGVANLHVVETVEVLDNRNSPTFEQYFSTLTGEESRGLEKEPSIDFPFKRYPVGQRYCYEDINIKWTPKDYKLRSGIFDRD
ncbi:hypothetical protein [Lysinibacillus xylanilyticus]|uniref:hypothetical protein n=1 Tax=Lysinibacillus xylanilyticus TaxID=582475 RepID=UPI0036D80BFF